MSRMSKIFNFEFLTPLSDNLKCYTPYELDVWLQSYEQFISAENNIKQKISTSFFANISKTISATSELIPLDHVAYTE